MADDDGRPEKNNREGRNIDAEDGIKENQACKEAQVTTAESQEDTGVAREGEDTPNLDLGDQGDSEVTREGRKPLSWAWGTGVTPRRPGRGRTTPSWTWGSGGTWRRPGRGRRPPS